MKYFTKTELLLIFSVFTKNVASITEHCHTGTGRCFGEGTTGSESWEDARAACQQDGGDLAVMETEELNDYVRDTFK